MFNYAKYDIRLTTDAHSLTRSFVRSPTRPFRSVVRSRVVVVYRARYETDAELCATALRVPTGERLGIAAFLTDRPRPWSAHGGQFGRRNSGRIGAFGHGDQRSS